MMVNKSILKQGSVAEILFIPLLAKASESKLNYPIIYVPKALEIVSQLGNVDDVRFDGGELSNLGIITRTEVIDLRKRFFSECNKIRFIPKSVLDSSWTNDIQI